MISIRLGSYINLNREEMVFHIWYKWKSNLPWPLFNAIRRHRRTLNVQTIATTMTFGLLRKEKWAEWRTPRDGKRSGNDYLVRGPVLLYTVGMPHSYFSSHYSARKENLISNFWKKFQIRRTRRFVGNNRMRSSGLFLDAEDAPWTMPAALNEEE